MKNKILAVAVVAVLSACSDGLAPVAPAALPSESCSIMLSAYKVGADVGTATSGEISIVAGEGIVLSWSAGGLTSAQLTSDPPEVVGQPIDLQLVEKEVEVPATEEGAEATTEKVKVLEGSQEFAGLTHSASFIVTGKNEQEGLALTDCTNGTLNVVVTEAPVPVTVNKFDASPSEIKAGGSTQLCWDVSPADAVVSIVDDKDNAVTVAEAALPVEETEPVVEQPVKEPVVEPVVESAPEPTPVTNKLIATAKAVVINEEGGEEEVPAEETPEEDTLCIAVLPIVGCATVTPAETAVYTLTATGTDGQGTTASTTVTVLPIELQILSFTANGQEGSLVLDKEGDVRLDWEVQPENAIVTIDNEVGEVKAKDNKTVTVKETTTYTLTASLDDKVLSKQVTVNITRLVPSDIKVTLSANTTSVFAGEEVIFEWAIGSAKSEESLPSDMKVTLNTPDGQKDVSGTSNITITPTAGGIYSLEIASGGGVFISNQVNVSVRSWKERKLGISTRGIGMVVKQTVLVGTLGKELAKKKYGIDIGMIVGGDLWEDVNVDVASVFSATYIPGFQSAKLLEQNPYNLSAFALDSDSGRVYAAGTGFIVYSDDSGKNWNSLDVNTYWDNIKEVPTCFGETHNGDPSKNNPLKNLVQYCALLVDRSGGTDILIAATDKGIAYLDGVDKRISDRDNHFWKSVEELKGVVFNTLTSFGGKIYAGGGKGVWVSDNRGESWAEFNGGSVDATAQIYALAVAEFGDKETLLLAAGPNGVYSTKISSKADWKKAGDVGGGVVYTLAVDPVEDGTIYTGTENGVFVSRDKGEKWVNISESMSGATAVYSLAVTKNRAEVGIYAATAGGAYSSIATGGTRGDAKKPLPATPEEPPATPPEQPAPAPAPEQPTPAPPSETIKTLLK